MICCQSKVEISVSLHKKHDKKGKSNNTAVTPLKWEGAHEDAMNAPWWAALGECARDEYTYT